jgi:hypothetical protein
MAETRMAIRAGVALSVMGAAQFLRHQGGLSTALKTVLLVIEIVAIVVGLLAIFTWVRLRERERPHERSGSS